MRSRLVALALVTLALSACGGGKGAAPRPPGSTTLANTTRTKPPAAAVRVTISAPTHRPRVNAPWPVRIRVTDTRGKPIPARLTMQILFNRAPVGKVDNGAAYHFVGTWQEPKGKEIVWPKDARRQPLASQAVVSAQGITVRKNWWIQAG